jgi:hypothetical protein
MEGRYIREYIPRLSDPKREENSARATQRRFIPTRFLAGIRGKDVAEFIGERQGEGAGANTVRVDRALLSRLFEAAGSDWGMESLSNPVKRADKPKLPSGRPRRLEGDAVEWLQAFPFPHSIPRTKGGDD